MSLKKKRSALQEDVESLTIHGPSRVASAKNKYTRMIWLMLCIATTMSFGIVAVSSLIKYYKYHTYSQTSVRHTKQLAIPTITFCHKYIDLPKSSTYDDRPVAQHLPKSCSFNNRKNFTNTINQKVFEIACRIFIGTFKSKTSAMKIETPQYFRFPKGFEIAPYSKPCVTLNRNLALVQENEGEKYGLHMIMYNEGYNLPYRVSTDRPLSDDRNGIYAVMHDPKQVVPIGDEISILPGYHTHISVTKNIVKRLPDPYPSKCTNDWSKRDSVYPGKNTHRMCTESCALKQLYKICSFVLPEMRVFMTASEYPMQADKINPSLLRCLLRSKSQIDYQLCDCPEHCYDEKYTTVIYHNSWPPHQEVPSLLKLIDNIEGKTNMTLSVNDIRERLMKLSIYYNEFKENVSEEQPLYDLLAIISDLGGQMGLFMGASLLSLAEILALAGQGFKRYLNSCHKFIRISPKPIT